MKPDLLSARCGAHRDPSCQYCKAAEETNDRRLETLAAERERLVATGRTLLDAAERHIFGDECKAERDAFRQALASIGEGDAAR